MTLTPSPFALAALLIASLAGCQKNAEPPRHEAANAAGGNALAAASPQAAAPAANPFAANLPADCRTLLTTLQTCADHLTATHSPAAPLFRSALEQTRETLPSVASDPGLAAQCRAEVASQEHSAVALGC